MNSDDFLAEENALIKRINEHKFYLGVIDGVSKADRKSKSKKADILNNANLLAILSHDSLKRTSNGVPYRPARPILDIAVKKFIKDKTVDRIYDGVIDGIFKAGWKWNDIEIYMNRWAERLASMTRKMIYDNKGILAPNAPSTIKAKKGADHPLFDTGQLARSIVCVWTDKQIKNDTTK